MKNNLKQSFYIAKFKNYMNFISFFLTSERAQFLASYFSQQKVSHIYY